jgi:hypothetical protein
MTARIGWLPFVKDIRNATGPIFIDYGNVEGSYHLITKLMGIYRKVNFQFSFKTLLTLNSELVKQGQVKLLEMKKKGMEVENDYQGGQDIQTTIVLEGALDATTINEFLYFLTINEKNRGTRYEFSDNTVRKMINYAIRKNQLKRVNGLL